MRSYQFLIFFSIVIFIYSLVNFYIFRHGMMALPQGTAFRRWYPWVFLFLSASYIIGRVLERVWISPVSNFFTFVGSFWLALMVYFLMAVIVIDLIRLVLYILPSRPEFLANNYENVKKYAFIAVTGIVGIVVLAGHINALNPLFTMISVDPC